ncbi:hypothetical protein Tco_0167195, partial [Tanacetum coccineum]
AVMSDSEDSTVTYTAVSSPFGGLSDIGSLGVSGPEYPPSPDFVPELVYSEFMPPEDEVLLAEKQPLPAAASPTANSPGYVPESDPEENPEEDNDEDPEENPADYPGDGGDDGDDEDESSDDDEDEDFDIEGDEDEEEHPAPADSTAVALLAVDHAPSVEETGPFETEVARLLAIPTPPPSPLSLWSSLLPQIPSPPLPPILSPLPVSPPLPVSSPPPASPILPLGYRAVMIRLRAKAPSTSHSPPPHIILSHTRPDALSSGTPPLQLLFIDRRADRPEVTLPPRKRLGIALCPRYEVGESSSAPTARHPRGFRADYGFVATIDREIMRDLKRDVSYGITDTWDKMPVDMPGAQATDDTEDRRAHARTARLIEAEVRMSREAWGQSMDASDLARAEVMSLHSQVVAQQAVIKELQAADRRRQAAITKMLAADHRRQAQFIEALKLLKRLQTHMTEFERQQGPAKGPAQPDALEEAGRSS